MKKSTTLMIILIYLASIVVIGFFGMKIKVYQPTNYIKSIEMSVEAEDRRMFTFESKGQDEEGNHLYSLTIHFQYCLETEETVNGVTVKRKYVPLSLIPLVTYKSGDIETKEDTVKYEINDTSLIDRGIVSLAKNGQFICYRNVGSFDIYIKPVEPNGSGTEAIIEVNID